MERWHLAVALVVCIGLAAYTSTKLHRMSRIVDETSVAQRVVRKTVEAGRRTDSCYLWVPERVQADCDYWDGVSVGDTVEIVVVDGEQHVTGGDVYTSKGNFMFDIVLLVAEIVGAIVCVVLLILRRRARGHFAQ